MVYFYLILQALEALYILGLLLLHGVLVAKLQLGVCRFALRNLGSNLDSSNNNNNNKT